MEAGKEATFFISDGDALDIMSNNLFSRNLDIVLDPPSTSTNLKPRLFMYLYIRFVKFLSGNLYIWVLFKFFLILECVNMIFEKPSLNI